MRKLLRERYDDNLGIILRQYEDSSGLLQYTCKRLKTSNVTPLCFEKPLYAHISLTNHCNLGCPYCYVNESNNEDMSTLDIIKLIKTCAENDIFSITWTGGEPFTRDDFIDIINLTNKAGLQQAILTNGTCIPNKFWKLAPRLNAIIQFSLNDAFSNNPETLEHHRIIFENIKRCNKLGLPNVLTIVLFPVSELTLDMLFQKLISNDVKVVRFGFLFPIGNAVLYEYKEYIEQMKDSMTCYLKMREKYHNQINVIYQFDSKKYEGTVLPRRFLMCEAGTTLIYIDHDGEVYPCPLFKSLNEFSCGNVKNTSWEDLWNSNGMKQLRQIPSCTSCDLMCKVWCRALKYFNDHRLEGKGPFCLKKL